MDSRSDRVRQVCYVWFGYGVCIYLVVESLSDLFNIGTGLRFVDCFILFILFRECLKMDKLCDVLVAADKASSKFEEERIEALQEKLEEADRALSNRIDWLNDNVKLKPSPLN